MKALVRKSSSSDTETVLAEVTKDIIDPKGIVIFTDYYRLAEISELTFKKYPNSQIIGTSGMSYCNDTVETNSAVFTFFMDEVEIIADLIPNLSKSPSLSIMNIARNAEEIRPGVDNTVCIEFCTGYEEVLISTFRTGFRLNSSYPEDIIKLIGGTVCIPKKDLKPLVTLNGKVYEDACVYFLIKNLKGKVKIYKEDIYQSLNNLPPYVATKIDYKNKAIVELDGQPAINIYTKELNLDVTNLKNDLVEKVCQYPIGQVINKEIYTFAVLNVKDDSSLISSKIINKNDKLCLLKLDPQYEKINLETVKKITDDFSSISLIFSIDSLYRYILFSRDKYNDTYIKNMSALGEYVGYIGYSEQINNQLVKQTMVCAVFE